MGIRPGVRDALLAFAVVSGLITMSDMVQRSRNAAHARAVESINRARLKRIEQNVAKLHEKL